MDFTFLGSNPCLLVPYHILEGWEREKESRSVAWKNIKQRSTAHNHSVAVTNHRSQFLSAMVSFLAALIGLLPTRASRFIAKKSLGKSWSATAIEAFLRNVLQYHTVRNMLFMAMTEFKKLVEAPDWVFMRGKQSQMAFLFGLDDHWGPLQMLDEIVKQIPGAVVEIEKEGHTHAFSCTKAGSLKVAQFVASLIKCQKSN